ncbi:MAG: dephospho-CoA kinase [Pseudolysinimonas sp.]
MYLIGLTGGIASGKSVVSKRLADRGAVLIDADLVAREVVEPGTPALALIAKEFGPTVIAADGSLDRPALGRLIFSDAEARLTLNAITHPAVWLRVLELVAIAEAADPRAVIVYDVPLLVEASADRPLSFDLVVVVHADIETRITRMVDLRGMSREEATHRLNSQATDAERLAIADVVIDSNGTLEHTIEQADELWAMASAAASAVSKPTQ